MCLFYFPISTLGRADTFYDALGFKVGKCFSMALAEMPIFSARATALNLPSSESKAMTLSLLFVGFSPPFEVFSLLYRYFLPTFQRKYNSFSLHLAFLSPLLFRVSITLLAISSFFEFARSVCNCVVVTFHPQQNILSKNSSLDV